MVKKIGEMGILLLGGGELGLGFLGIAFMNQMWQFIPLVIIVGMGFYTMHSTLQTRATELAPKARGTAVSLFAFALFFGQSIGTFAMGKVQKAWGYAAVFELCGAGLLLLAIWARTQLPRFKTVQP